MSKLNWLVSVLVLITIITFGWYRAPQLKDDILQKVNNNNINRIAQYDIPKCIHRNENVAILGSNVGRGNKWVYGTLELIIYVNYPINSDDVTRTQIFTSIHKIIFNCVGKYEWDGLIILHTDILPKVLLEDGNYHLIVIPAALLYISGDMIDDVRDSEDIIDVINNGINTREFTFIFSDELVIPENKLNIRDGIKLAANRYLKTIGK